jgi:hypothetical protein
MKISKTLLAIILLFSIGAVAHAQDVSTCVVAEKFHCAPGASCQSMAVNVVLRIDWAKAKYSRCDTQGCDDYDMITQQAGNYINIVPIPPNGSIAKVAIDDGSFLEVATLMLSTLVSFGTCK